MPGNVTLRPSNSCSTDSLVVSTQACQKRTPSTSPLDPVTTPWHSRIESSARPVSIISLPAATKQSPVPWRSVTSCLVSVTSVVYTVVCRAPTSGVLDQLDPAGTDGIGLSLRSPALPAVDAALD